MGGEYFLAQDYYNFDDEITHLIFTESLNKDDLRCMYDDELITEEDFDYYCEFYDFINEELVKWK